MKFSLLVVCLNPGEKLKKTLESALMQDYKDYEIIIKDGKSKDGSVEEIPGLFPDAPIRIFAEPDKGIYDAMNQAVSYAAGEYVFFLNCGDRFHDGKVLSRMAWEIDKLSGPKLEAGATPGGVAEAMTDKAGEAKETCKNAAVDVRGMKKPARTIFYGNIYGVKNGVWITPSPRIDGFTCYRNVPCHQACFYDTSLCREKPFEQKYRIRGDYEQFLWCYFKGGASFVYVDMPIADYEGGGYSETKENLRRSKVEHREITGLYMTKKQLFKYRMILLLTLAPLRRAMSESKAFSGIYNRIRNALYHIKKR